MEASRHDPFVALIADWFADENRTETSARAFQLFLLFHLYLYAHAYDSADCIVDVNRIAVDPQARRAAEATLSDSLRFPISLMDARTSFGLSLFMVGSKTAFIEAIDQFVKQISGPSISLAAIDFVAEAKDQALAEWERHEFYSGGARSYFVGRLKLADQLADERRAALTQSDAERRRLNHALELLTRKRDALSAIHSPLLSDTEMRQQILAKFVSRKLNLGCGFDKRPGYINIDGQTSYKPDIVADVTNLHMLPSLTFEEIAARDVLEHFHWRDTPRALYEWNRVLQPDGRMFIRTAYPNGSVNRHESIPDLGSVSFQNLFSVQRYATDYSLTVFMERLLRFYLWAGGFAIEEIKVGDQRVFELWAKKIMDHSYSSLIENIVGDEGFVNECYRRILERPADPTGLSDHLKLLADCSLTRERLIKAFLLSQEKQDRLEAHAREFDLTFPKPSPLEPKGSNTTAM